MGQEALQEEVVCDAMANPLVHALVFGAAVIIPGGLLVYFAWRAYKARSDRIAADTRMSDATEAFRQHFPVQSDSLRTKNRLAKLSRYRHRIRKHTK